MVIIIQGEESKLKINNKGNFIILKDICEIKRYLDYQYVVMLVDLKIDDEGLVENFGFFFEELVITLKIVAVITNKSNPKLREICDFHKISLLELNY